MRFINPGDIRVAAKTCSSSQCHDSETRAVGRSMMANGQMLWGAALYNNGGFPLKDARFAESYSESGAPQRLIQTPAPSVDDKRTKGLLERSIRYRVGRFLSRATCCVFLNGAASEDWKWGFRKKTKIPASRTRA